MFTTPRVEPATVKVETLDVVFRDGNGNRHNITTVPIIPMAALEDIPSPETKKRLCEALDRKELITDCYVSTVLIDGQVTTRLHEKKVLDELGICALDFVRRSLERQIML